MSGKHVLVSLLSAIVLATAVAVAADDKVVPCSLVTQADIEAAMGKLREAPKSEPGLQVRSDGHLEYAKPLAEKAFSRLK